MKNKVIYICSSCGSTSSKWSGKCPDCGSWNTMNEEVVSGSASKATTKTLSTYIEPSPLSDVKTDKETRYSSGISELDRVLGGGIVQGSLVLIGGEPGIGKSTLLLQICQYLNDKVLYISGEESAKQIKLRAERLEITNPYLSLLCTTNLENVTSAIEKTNPKVAIVDSVQTISSDDLSSAPGTVSQIREVTHSLMHAAKLSNTTIFIVGHVTKDGTIAGPRVLEHMVDCVLYFEGDNNNNFRVLRAVKNRFGSTNEVGIFEMCDKGLVNVDNPSTALLENHEFYNSGSCITCTIEGTRPILTEVQALVTPTFFPAPRRTAAGVDYNRVVLLLAVLEKRFRVNLSNYDTYLNIAGGLRLSEPSSDLAIVLSIYSNYKDIIIDNKTLVVGEVGLSGEIRPVSNISARVNEALKLGFNKIIIPYSNLKSLTNKTGVIGVKSLKDAIDAISN